jgi:UDPglucose 6-dehydrogenase
MARVCVIGAGYVGLTTGTCLASLGHLITFLDSDLERISLLQTGVLPIFEPGLQDLFSQGIIEDRITLTADSKVAITNAQFVFLCVPTPQDEDGSADLSHIISAVREIRSLLSSNCFLITKSTVPVGSSHLVSDLVNREDVTVLSNPEFLREGSALNDFMFPDRIVVGTSDPTSVGEFLDLFESIPGERVITDRSSAELIKYVSNCLLAIRLSFINDVAAFCEKIGANMKDVKNGVSLDKRIGQRFLEPGPGWGGSCLPKDLPALRAAAEKVGIVMPLLTASIESNDRAHKRVVDRVEEYLGGSLSGRRIGVLGLAFKANTNDTRNSPALEVIKRFISRGAVVSAYDPEVLYVLDPAVNIQRSAAGAADGAHALVVLTEWEEFEHLSPVDLLSAMDGRLILDTRDILNSERWLQAGAQLIKIGQAG